MQNKNRGFSSNLGAILAAAGGAIGLGNIWRFPYTLGANGGSAFLLVYILFVFLLGVPVMMGELTLGRLSQSNVTGTFRTLAPKHKSWMGAGILALLSTILLYSFYSVVAGWTLNYVVLSFNGGLSGKTPAEISQVFADFTQGSFWPLAYQFVFLILTALVVVLGVQKGIEKGSKILMPLLFIFLILMCVRSLTLNGAKEGIDFLLKPDFSKLNADSIVDALGQALFSLSIGVGALITYGSYIRKEDNLLKTSLWIACADLFVAVMAGFAIFPAVFSFGLSPAAGPSLVYEVLPNVFNSMPLGSVFAIVFFLLLTIATLTSTISLLEIVVLWSVEELHWSRVTSSIVSSLVVFAFGIFSTLSFGVLHDFHICGLTIFDFLDSLTANYMMPIGALLFTLFLGWYVPKTEVKNEITNAGKLKAGYFEAYYFVLRYLAPLALLVVLIMGIF